MAKAQTQQAAGQVNQANQQVQQDVGNVVANQGGLQSRADAEAQKTLATSQGLMAPAQSLGVGEVRSARAFLCFGPSALRMRSLKPGLPCLFDCQ